LNAEQAARAIGCSSKTVLRHIARGTISATHKHAQELDIAEDQVEKLKQVLTLAKSRQSTDVLQELELLTLRVQTLEEKVQTLESVQPSLPVPTEPSTVPTTKDTYQPQQSPQKPTTIPSSTIPSDLPTGTLTSTQFRKQHAIEKIDMDAYIQRGIFGAALPMIRIPHPTRAGYTLTYFTPEDQEKAIEVLKRHGKIQ